MPFAIRAAYAREGRVIVTVSWTNRTDKEIDTAGIEIRYASNKN